MVTLFLKLKKGLEVDMSQSTEPKRGSFMVKKDRDVCLAAVSTLNPVENTHGKWIRVFDDSAGWVDMCSKCKEFGDGTPYCPNCGKKMDG